MKSTLIVAHSIKYQSGAAFLMVVVLLILSGTALMVSQVSINHVHIQRSQKTLQKMHLAQDALLGYALSHAVPGTLPCPDATGDGDANAVVGGCSVTAGWLPSRTLGLDKLVDSSGTVLWYAVDPNYTTAAMPFNSSSASRLNYHSIESAFIVIAANNVLGSQVRNGFNPTASNYLEGMNADANLYDFQYQSDDNHNDQLLSYSISAFWQMIESHRVLPEAISALTRYQNACNALPWAAAFNDVNLNSAVGLQQGSLPTTSAIASDGSACGTGLVVAPWFENHWVSQLQYRFCLNAEGQCLSIVGDSLSSAVAVVVSPGSILTGQNRMTNLFSDYFENDNQDLDTQFDFLNVDNHSGSFNDVLQFLP